LRLLVDNALSPLVAQKLVGAGHDALHVRDLGMQAATDEEIFEVAVGEGRTMVSADTDSGTILALRSTAEPSVLIFRRSSGRRPEEKTRRTGVRIAACYDAATYATAYVSGCATRRPYPKRPVEWSLRFLKVLGRPKMAWMRSYG
jgi:predicted nuclease of predicted toxin-antitoxin system